MIVWLYMAVTVWLSGYLYLERFRSESAVSVVRLLTQMNECVS